MYDRGDTGRLMEIDHAKNTKFVKVNTEKTLKEKTSEILNLINELDKKLDRENKKIQELYEDNDILIQEISVIDTQLK